MRIAYRKANYLCLIIFLFCVGSVSGATRARLRDESGSYSGLGLNVVYVSPLPGSKNLTPGTNIIIRSSDGISAGSVNDNLFKVVGSSSGVHYGRVILVSDGHTVLFQPQTPFQLGETVSVSETYPLLSAGGDTIQLNPFVFTIAADNLNGDEALIQQIGYGIPRISAAASRVNRPPDQTEAILDKAQLKYELEGLPATLPPLAVTKSNNPTPGYIFLATNMEHKMDNIYGNYLIIADTAGNPIFYRNIGQERGWDFNIQPTGVLTYFQTSVYPNGVHYVMNTSLKIIDTVSCGNGYPNDGHEMRILPNGNIFLIGDDYETINMSKIVSGGDSNATVIGNVIQELDKNKNVIFQWRSLDYFNITDAIGQNLDSSVVDPFHCNSIAIDSDGNILISDRHLSEITKINVQTGDIMWRLGGKNNQFTFVNDTIGFSYQHDIRILANGDITLMDNGNMHTPPFSRALEYKLDDVNKTATLVWQFRHNPDAYNPFMGNVQRLPDGNTLIGWGGAPSPAVTEVTPDGNTALEMTFPYDSVLSYRAYSYPFLFVTSPTVHDTLAPGDTTMLTWQSAGLGTINIDYSTDDGISWNSIATDYPANADSITFSMPADTVSSLQFRMIQFGTTDSGMTYFSRKIPVAGGLSGIVKHNSPYTFSLSNNYPNPFNPSTVIEYHLGVSGRVTLVVYDVLGRRVRTLVDKVQGPGEHIVKFNGSMLASGVYFYRLMTSSGFVQTKKMLLEK